MRVVPLHQRLVDTLSADVAEGLLKPGNRLPTEAGFSRLYGVRRITVRQALDILRQRGLVERFPSRGSFVSMRAHTGWKIESVDDLIHLAGEIRTSHLDWGKARPPEEVAALVDAPRAHGVFRRWFFAFCDEGPDASRGFRGIGMEGGEVKFPQPQRRAHEAIA